MNSNKTSTFARRCSSHLGALDEGALAFAAALCGLCHQALPRSFWTVMIVLAAADRRMKVIHDSMWRRDTFDEALSRGRRNNRRSEITSVTSA